MKRSMRYNIQQGGSGSVGDFLKKEHGVSTRQIRAFRDAGNLLMDQRPVGMRDSIRGHEVLEIFWESEEACSVPPNDLPIEVVYEDADILIVNKPSGMPTHPSQDHEMDTLAGAVTAHWIRQGESHCFRPVGRLDRETSGLMLIGKSAWVTLMLEHQKQVRQLSRCYTAVVEGALRQMRGTVMAPIGRVPGSIILRQVVPDGQLAVTDYEVGHIMKNATGVYLRLTTGRTHQIRVHMASIGHSLINDGLYGCRYDRNMADGHLALQSTGLYLVHPVTKQPMHWSLDPIWKNALRDQ